MSDPYSILGVKRDASADEVKRAYRKLAKTWHPDHNADKKKAQERFSQINSAYEIIGDDAKRKAFDRGEIGADGKPRSGFEGAGGNGPGGYHFDFGAGGPFGGPRPGGGAGDPRDAFSDLFRQFQGANARPGAGQGAGQRGGRSPIPPGEDVALDAAVPLETVASGGVIRVALPDGRTIEVKVPQGAAHGTVMRLKGQGSPSPFGGPSGDALLTLRHARHGRFTPEGADLRVSVQVPIRDAVLGGAVRVPTLDGEVEVSIPAWTSGGRTLRLKGKGLPLKERTGDLLVSLDIDLGPPDAEIEGFFRRRMP